MTTWLDGCGDALGAGWQPRPEAMNNAHLFIPTRFARPKVGPSTVNVDMRPSQGCHVQQHAGSQCKDCGNGDQGPLFWLGPTMAGDAVVNPSDGQRLGRCGSLR